MKLFATTTILLAGAATAIAQPSQQSVFACGGTLQTAREPNERVPEVQPLRSLFAQHATESNKRIRGCQPTESELDQLSLEAQSQQDRPTIPSITSKPATATKADEKG